MPVTDATYAGFARTLADALRMFARERRDEDKKFIAQVHTELCALRRREIEESKADEGSPDNPPE